jgi:Uma2 family endonuclease
MAEPVKKRMTVDEFLAWAQHQPGRYELHAGIVVGMSPERNMHARTKRDAMVEFMRAVAVAGVDCEVFPDGTSVVIDDSTTYEPDVAINCGPRAENLSLSIDSPAVVVEVTSPSSGTVDTGSKLIGYMQTQSVRHILILDPVTRVAIHHARTGPTTFASKAVSGGPLVLDPPGIEVRVEAFFASV